MKTEDGYKNRISVIVDSRQGQGVKTTDKEKRSFVKKR